MTFREWLNKQRQREHPIGDLANDAIPSKWNGHSFCSLRVAMRSERACSAAHDAGREAFGEYLAEIKNNGERKYQRNKVTPRLRYSILQRDGFRCVLCGAAASIGATLHVDHKIPISKGGRSEEENLQTLCAPCNFGKGALI